MSAEKVAPHTFELDFECEMPQFFKDEHMAQTHFSLIYGNIAAPRGDFEVEEMEDGDEY